LLSLAREGLSVGYGHSLVAPNAIRSQALDLLLEEATLGRLSDEAALHLHERITEVKMRLLGDRVSRRVAWQLAREHGWPTIRDAEYLAVARLQADALIATAADLKAKAKGIVPLATLSDLARSGCA
jgi:predicted nucleic acid-binding protein